MLQRFSRRWFGMAVLLGCSAVSGCGSSDRPELGQVTGQVTLDGQPLMGVNILFRPDIGRAAADTTDAEGRYELQYLDGVSGCKIGPNTVSFEWPPDAESPPQLPAEIPGAKVDIKSGDNKFDFPLTSPSP